MNIITEILKTANLTIAQKREKLQQAENNPLIKKYQNQNLSLEDIRDKLETEYYEHQKQLPSNDDVQELQKEIISNTLSTLNPIIFGLKENSLEISKSKLKLFKQKDDLKSLKVIQEKLQEIDIAIDDINFILSYGPGIKLDAKNREILIGDQKIQKDNSVDYLKKVFLGVNPVNNASSIKDAQSISRTDSLLKKERGKLSKDILKKFSPKPKLPEKQNTLKTTDSKNSPKAKKDKRGPSLGTIGG